LVEENAFAEIVEEIKGLEKKAIGYKGYDGAVEIKRYADLYPAEYVDINYPDLLNLYERAEKIIAASKMKIFAPGVPTAEVVPPEAAKKKVITETEAKKIEEAESKLRTITTEALKKAEEIAAAAPPVPEAKPEEKPKPHLEIELEREKPAELPSELELEFEKPEKAHEEEILKKPREEEAPSLERAPPEEKFVEKRPEEEKLPSEEAEVLMPKILESPDEAAEKKYKQIEEEVVSTIGEKADEAAIKKKMLELTKELFKEKSIDRREAIKHEIAALKNMLSAMKTEAGRKIIAKAKKTKKPSEVPVAHFQVFQTLLSTQSSEIAQTKDSITNSYKHKMDALQKKFYEDITMAESADKKKKLYDNLVFELTKLSEQLPETIKKFRDYTTKKHLAELKKLRESIGAEEKDIAVEIDEKISIIEKRYEEEFAALQDIIAKRIDSLIRTAARDVFEKKGGEEEAVSEEANVDDIISEINNLDPGTLLYYLHSKNPEYFKKYERKHISHTEALTMAKILMAKEKGLNPDIIRKYFGTVEGYS